MPRWWRERFTFLFVPYLTFKNALWLFQSPGMRDQNSGLECAFSMTSCLRQHLTSDNGKPSLYSGEWITPIFEFKLIHMESWFFLFPLMYSGSPPCFYPLPTEESNFIDIYKISVQQWGPLGPFPLPVLLKSIFLAKTTHILLDDIQ